MAGGFIANCLPARHLLILLLAGGLPTANCFSQDTFSICAVDTITGEVGSAGASCIDASAIAGGVVIISDVHPGRGVIHTQAAWISANQNTAKNQMNLGKTPQQIINWMQANDAQFNPAVRQYGVVDFDSNGKARTAAFTGANCMNYKNHIVGPNYTIQGNILLGQQILDSMEARFLRSEGDLACKLMSALQGANVVGADTRCINSGNSSLSSFLRVAKTGEVMPNIYLNIVIAFGPAGFEPLDSLQTRFDLVHSCLTGVKELQAAGFNLKVNPNPVIDNVRIIIGETATHGFSIELFNSLGQKILTEEIKNANESSLNVSAFERGIYFYKVTLQDGKTSAGKLMKD